MALGAGEGSASGGITSTFTQTQSASALGSTVLLRAWFSATLICVPRVLWAGNARTVMRRMNDQKR